MTEQATARTYTPAFRIVAAAIAVVAIAKHLAGDFPDAAAERSLLFVRGAGACLALGIAVLASIRPTMERLQRLAFALGLDVALICLGVVVVVPAQLWEQTATLVGMMFAAALFMPWSWRWQGWLVGVTVAGATVLLLVVPAAGHGGGEGGRALITLCAMGALSVVGANLADRARRQLAATEAVRMHEQRLDALGRFAGGIAHQFNNLLGGILTHISVLRTDVSLKAGATQLDEVAAAARRGRDLTEELMRFTRSEPVRVRPTDANRVLEGVAALGRALLPEGAKVQLTVAPQLPPLAGDLDHLVHACTQVVLNARDAMRGRPDPRLDLAASLQTIGARDPRWRDVPPGDYIRISISDTGRGMDAATVARAFEPFYSTKPMHQATGLGLATVLRVMRDHGGAARVESEPSRGTTLHLLLPVSKEPLPALPPLAPAGGGGRRGPICRGGAGRCHHSYRGRRGDRAQQLEARADALRLSRARGGRRRIGVGDDAGRRPTGRPDHPRSRAARRWRGDLRATQGGAA